jgi:hypothetical protein
MNEEQWQSGASPVRMVDRIGLGASQRKLRLFACAATRRVWEEVDKWEQYPNNPHRKTVEAAERFADGTIDAETFAMYRPADFDVEGVVAEDAYGAAWWAVTHLVTSVPDEEAEWIEQAKLLWEIFGNPFRSVVFSPEWRTDTALSLARTMYESREFSAMPILADALQDAGCDNDDILNHCRDVNQIHVRGCWVCDLVLEKK